jgi:hypothetical protein
MSKTRIFTCRKETTAEELVDFTDAYINIYFPEVRWTGLMSVPIHEHQQVEVALGLIGQTFMTLSGAIIRTFMREVRLGRLPASDLEIYCDGELQEIDIKGDLILPWPGGFYETTFNLLFHDEV